MKKVILLIMMASLVGCSALRRNDVNIQEKYKINTVAMKNWEETFGKVMVGESELEDWYGAENPIKFLAQTGKLDEKQVKFLDSLKTEKTITEDQQEKFISILDKIVDKLPREYFLKDENLKDPSGLAKYMVTQSYIRLQNPSNHIKDKVATQEEWNEIIAYSKQNDMSEKDTKNFRKLLNRFMKRSEFFDSRSWYTIEVSPRMIQVNNIYKKEDKTKLEKNNINAKAMYIAYSEYFSKLDKWDD
ncbi:hypothetical protein [uncultured Cetobacterium sp.]|uniref:hypothetical protein n=1 Tax=uncultured Cetobacterium sp. TaxID=527638 RepID=UPI00261AB8E2|nr:hypothetical protein [uncultured Cetobacterium sp.]